LTSGNTAVYHSGRWDEAAEEDYFRRRRTSMGAMDSLDGWLARKFKVASDFGALFDIKDAG
jgi:CDP-alcohol phosphatidyltransferase